MSGKKAEKDFRSVVVSLLRPIGAFPVENLVHDGCPDVCCVAGWIELKVASRPKRVDSRVDVEVRPAQRLWLKKWRTHGARAWTLTLLDETWILHDGEWASEHLGRCDEHTLLGNSLAAWSGKPDAAELIKTLTSRRPDA